MHKQGSQSRQKQKGELGNWSGTQDSSGEDQGVCLFFMGNIHRTFQRPILGYI